MATRIEDILITWVGSHDPVGWNPRTKKDEVGPILSLLGQREFDAVYLFVTIFDEFDDFRRRATDVLRICRRDRPRMRVSQKPQDIISVTDHRELYRAMNDTCQEILREEGTARKQYYVLLSPGTPQMATVWVLLVQSGLLPAKMLITTPPDFLPEGQLVRWKEVDLSLPDFPQVVTPGETQRLLGILEAQNDNLRSENFRLRGELDLLRSGVVQRNDGSIPEGFSLQQHLVAQERAYYELALSQADDNGAAAARLLGLQPHTFRAGAERLGLRSRRPKSAAAGSPSNRHMRPR
jgi:hypothetical protein